LLSRHHRGDARAALAILWIEAFVRQRTSARIDEIMTPDLSEEEKIALVDLLKRTVEADHYPLSLGVLEGAAPHTRRGHAAQRHQRAEFGFHPRRRLLAAAARGGA
jgi:hypothetical protein